MSPDSGGTDQRALMWDPDQPESGPVELGRHKGPVNAVAVLPHGRVVSGGTDRVLVWNASTHAQIAQLGCSATSLAAYQANHAEAYLAVVHEGQGFSVWSIIKSDDEKPF